MGNELNARSATGTAADAAEPAQPAQGQRRPRELAAFFRPLLEIDLRGRHPGGPYPYRGAGGGPGNRHLGGPDDGSDQVRPQAVLVQDVAAAPDSQTHRRPVSQTARG